MLYEVITLTEAPGAPAMEQPATEGQVEAQVIQATTRTLSDLKPLHAIEEGSNAWPRRSDANVAVPAAEPVQVEA